MEDIYQWYRQGLLFYGPYRSYFGRSHKPFSEYSPKTQYSPERHTSVSEGERKEQHSEIKPANTIETKQESSQKVEQKKETTEKQNEISPNKIVGPAEYQTERSRTDITKKRPANPYDRVEAGW